MSDDEGYVHDPAAFDEDGERRDDGSDRSTDARTSVHPTDVDRTFGWRGWTLVGLIGLAFVVAPLAIYLIPPGGEGYRFALIVLPLFPALLLALAAVWATTRP